MNIQNGLTIQGYELMERIGAGGFGAVYRAYQSTMGREVAVKIILPVYADHPEFIRHFEREVQLIARLEHLHIVPLYDYWRGPDGAYIVMRWLRGGSLGAALRKGAFYLEPASLLLDQVAGALAAAHHEQIVHCDLKPSNILLDEEGNAYLADFGIASDLRSPNGTDGRGKGRKRLDFRREEQILGSIQYLSPEQLLGQEVTPQSDIYSLGITLYEVLSGQHPFPGLNSVQQIYKHIDEPLPRIENLDSEVSGGVNEILQKATAKNPKLRFQDALAMAAAFRATAKLNQDRPSADLVESLTRREQEILHLIIEGHTNSQIGQTLFLELSTIKWHVNRIYKKLGVRSRVQAIVRARELDLIVTLTEIQLEPAQKHSTGIVLQEPANPYKGLRAFEPADNRHFFGREALVEHLLTRLAPTNASRPRQLALDQATNGSERFLAIVGPSGSGKSSLIKAGLIPALWSGQLTGSNKWFIVDMLPGVRPLDNLEVALTRIAADQAGNLREHLDRDSHGLARAARLILPNDESELVVVIDQFEELYTLVGDESARNNFMDLIQGAVTDPHSRVRVVIALRADYYDRPLQYPAFGELVRGHLETLLPLSAEELERAIVEPAHQTGVTFEPGLVASIIEDVNYRPGTLPLLQYALAELFEQRDERMLTQSAYLALGGAAGALARRAEELYQEQIAEGREAIHQMFLRLVSVGDPMTGAALDVPSPAVSGKRVLRSELLSVASNPERLDEIIDTYVDYRLLTLDHDPATRRPTIELAHEAILRGWDRLGGWLEESRVDLSLHHQLVQATRDWIEAGGDQSFLLRGTRLDRFESWVADTPLVLTEDERAYLEASIGLREEKTAAERERIENKSRLERQSNRRLKALVVLMTLALVIATGLSISAISFARQAGQQQRLADEQQQLAEEQRLIAEEQTHFAEVQQRLAKARELASAAVANLEINPERSILLALKAAETTYLADGSIPPEVERILHLAVQADRIETTIPMAGTSAYSPDGKLLAIGNSNGILKLWDTETGQEVHKLNGHLSLISGLSFSPDGRFLASSSFDFYVRIWDVASGSQIGAIKEFDDQVNFVAFSPDARLLATADQEGLVRIWDMTSVIDRTAGESSPIYLTKTVFNAQPPEEAIDVVFSPDGERVAVFVPSWGIIVWDVESGEQVLEITGVTEFASSIAYSPNGQFLVGGSGDLGAAVWDADTGEQMTLFPETAPITHVAFSQDGHTLATSAKNGMVALWDFENLAQKFRFFGQPTVFNFLALSPDGKQVAVGNDPQSTSLWDVSPTGSREVLTIAAHQGKVYDAIYNLAGTLIASTGEDGMVRVFDGITGELMHSLPAQRDWVHFPAFSPDGHRLAAANRDGGVTIWDATTGEKLMAMDGDGPALTAVKFSPDGSNLVAGGQEGIAYVWDTATGQRLATIQNSYEYAITELVYSQNGDHIFSYDWQGLSNTWNGTTGRNEVEGNLGYVCEATLWDAELSSDGQLQAVAAFNGQAYIFRAQGESEDVPLYSNLHSLSGHEGNVTGVAFNPQGSIMASSGFDGMVKLWDTDAGEEIATLTQQSLPLEGVDFSPDGRHVVTAGDDGMVRIYIVSVEELMEVARSQLSRGFTREECRTYLHLPSCVEN